VHDLIDALFSLSFLYRTWNTDDVVSRGQEIDRNSRVREHAIAQTQRAQVLDGGYFDG
jgi:hypothetical protein